MVDCMRNYFHFVVSLVHSKDLESRLRQTSDTRCQVLEIGNAQPNCQNKFSSMKRAWNYLFLCRCTAVPDPDFQMDGGGLVIQTLTWRGGLVSQNNFFRPFGHQFGLKIGGRAPRPLPLNPPLSSKSKGKTLSRATDWRLTQTWFWVRHKILVSISHF